MPALSDVTVTRSPTYCQNCARPYNYIIGEERDDRCPKCLAEELESVEEERDGLDDQIDEMSGEIDSLKERLDHTLCAVRVTPLQAKHLEVIIARMPKYAEQGITPALHRGILIFAATPNDPDDTTLGELLQRITFQIEYMSVPKREQTSLRQLIRKIEEAHPYGL